MGSQIRFTIVAAGHDQGSRVLDGVVTTPKELENCGGTMDLKMLQGTELKLTNLKVYDRPTMVDYLRSGW